MALVFVGSVAGTIAGSGLGNKWYPIALTITGPLFVLLSHKKRRLTPSFEFSFDSIEAKE